MLSVFDSNNAMWSDVDTLLGALKTAANLTVAEQDALAGIDTFMAANNFMRKHHATYVADKIKAVLTQRSTAH